METENNESDPSLTDKGSSVTSTEVINASDVQTVDAASLFGSPPKDGEADDVFSVDVPVDSGFRVQKGKQPLKLIDLAKGTSKASNPMWIWTFVVLLGKDAGKELKSYTALTAAAMWKLRETLAAFRLGGASGGEQAKFKRSDVIGKFVMADIEDASYEGRPSSNIAKLYPVADADIPRIDAAAKQALVSSTSPF